MSGFFRSGQGGDLAASQAAQNAAFAGDGGAGLVGFKTPTGTRRTVAEKLGEAVSVWNHMTTAQLADVVSYGATIDVTDAVMAAISAVGKTGRVYFPAGVYRLSPIALNAVRGLSLEGAGAALASTGVRYPGNTIFVFDNAGAGTDGLTITDFAGLTIKDILFSMRRGGGDTGSGGGTCLNLYNGHDYTIQNVRIDLRVGGGGAGLVLGGGNGATATFVGTLTNVKVFSHTSVAIKLNFGTSIKLESCYQVGGWIELYGMTYCTVDNCASELAPNYYGYLVNGCSNIVFNGCGAEGNARGAFYLSGTSSNITFVAPYGAGNNTAADTTVGDLIHMDSGAGAVNNVTIINPTSVATNGATQASIYATAGTGRVQVIGEDSTLLQRGIGGNAQWMATRLTRTGDREHQTWAPILSNWANSAPASVAGGYVKKGDTVTWWVKVTPALGGTLSAARPNSTINGLPFTPTAAIGTMVDDNGTSYGAVAIGPTGIIYPQTITGLSVGFTIMGTLVQP